MNNVLKQSRGLGESYPTILSIQRLDYLVGGFQNNVHHLYERIWMTSHDIQIHEAHENHIIFGVSVKDVATYPF
jgi:hypothetical protein